MSNKTMAPKTKFRPSPALVIACLALFAALSGTALAAKASIGSNQIVNGSVRTVDLRDSAVNSAKVADTSITANDLGTDSVGSDEIAKDAVKSDEIAESAVTSSEVADQSLTQNDLGPDSVGSSEIQAGAIRSSELGPIIQVSNSTPIAATSSGSVSVGCPAGTTVISGGGQPDNFGVEMTSTLRSGNGWLYQAKNNNAAASKLTVFAYCLTGGSSN
jgi:hypothetical protein